MNRTIRTAAAILALFLLSARGYSQTDERLAYMPSKAIARTADDTRIGFKNGALPGVVSLELPQGTWRVDILDTRGGLDHTMEGRELETLDLGSLTKGTWTLRAHTPEGYSIRRFIVLQRGTVAWALPPAPRKR